MVMTPTDTMITRSMLLSKGEVGLPWGLLLPVRVGRKGLLFIKTLLGKDPQQKQGMPIPDWEKDQ